MSQITPTGASHGRPSPGQVPQLIGAQWERSCNCGVIHSDPRNHWGFLPIWNPTMTQKAWTARNINHDQIRSSCGTVCASAAHIWTFWNADCSTPEVTPWDREDSFWRARGGTKRKHNNYCDSVEALPVFRELTLIHNKAGDIGDKVPLRGLKQ